MKLILLSGGSGKRLWPLSNDSRSKQFLKILQNDSGKNVSMLQRVWEQLKQCNLHNNSIITTNQSQSEMIFNQIKDNVRLVIEPERRDTFPAIVLASLYLYEMEHISEDEIVVVLPVDPYVDPSFFRVVESLEGVLNETKADLALIGVKPTYPSEKYGYIVPESGAMNSSCSSVKSFREKPDYENAKELVDQGALWNCGVFAFRLKYLFGIISKREIPLDYEFVKSNYTMLPKISFDYEVVERAENIVVVPYTGYWKDLGTWNTLTEEMNNFVTGRGVLNETALNTHIINELDVPVVTLGISNAIIAVSSDGILISDKEESQKIKDFVNGINDRLMYEEKQWGWYRVLDFTKYSGGEEVLIRRICISKGKNLSYHYHKKRTELWTIVNGEAEIIIDSRIHHVKAGNVFQILQGKKHAVRALTDLEFIEVQRGEELSELDIYRLTMDWNQIQTFVGL
ncbi:sugar phosphate nucleotidyltransferase [Paenibacillus filicis]|uniref:Sugar phosphate nucleotidyltransferase n=1 Tax=Paenibacillus filicis TaxID=669464 RepID=A0ABU9DQC6_9BACL